MNDKQPVNRAVDELFITVDRAQAIKEKLERGEDANFGEVLKDLSQAFKEAAESLGSGEKLPKDLEHSLDILRERKRMMDLLERARWLTLEAEALEMEADVLARKIAIKEKHGGVMFARAEDVDEEEYPISYPAAGLCMCCGQDVRISFLSPVDRINALKAGVLRLQDCPACEAPGEVVLNTRRTFEQQDAGSKA